MSCPTARHASRIVEPCGIVLSAPSIVTVMLPESPIGAAPDQSEFERRLDGVEGQLSQTADGGIPHDCTDLRQKHALVRTRGKTTQCLVLSHGADSAGNALPTRLIAEEGCDPGHDLHEIGRVVEDDHGA